MIFEFSDSQILFGMCQEFQKATPYGGARKLRLNLPPVCRGQGWPEMAGDGRGWLGMAGDGRECFAMVGDGRELPSLEW